MNAVSERINTPVAGVTAVRQSGGNSALCYLGTALRYTIVSVIALGLLYPALLTGIGALAFPRAADGSLISRQGHIIGSEIVGQSFVQAKYFHGRSSAAGAGYDPTQTGGTNLGPTSKKLMDSVASAANALRKDNPESAGSALPPDLVTSSASGIDPDITPEAARFQAGRIAAVRHLTREQVEHLIAAHIKWREFGLLGEPRVNVLELNLALDGMKPLLPAR